MGNIIIARKNGVPVPYGTHINAVQVGAGSSRRTLATMLNNDYYTKAQVNSLLAGVEQFEPVKADTLPTASSSTMYKLYLIPKTGATDGSREAWITVAENVEPVVPEEPGILEGDTTQETEERETTTEETEEVPATNNNLLQSGGNSDEQTPIGEEAQEFPVTYSWVKLDFADVSNFYTKEEVDDMVSGLIRPKLYVDTDTMELKSRYGGERFALVDGVLIMTT